MVDGESFHTTFNDMVSKLLVRNISLDCGTDDVSVDCSQLRENGSSGFGVSEVCYGYVTASFAGEIDGNGSTNAARGAYGTVRTWSLQSDAFSRALPTRYDGNFSQQRRRNSLHHL